MQAKNNKLLVLLTNSYESTKNKIKTGFDVRELAIMLQELKSKWSQRTKNPQEFMDLLTFASPNGGPAPIDPKSVEMGQKEPSVKEFLGDYEAINRIRNTEEISNLNPEDYMAILIPGGHGVLYDLAENSEIGNFLQNAYERNCVICAVCHGTAAFISIKNPKNPSEPFVRNRKMTCLSNEEERYMNWSEEVPYLLEDKLRQMGANLSFASNPHESHVVVDERIITGQNTESAKEVIEQMTSMIESFRN